jgi:hypothetical protein
MKETVSIVSIDTRVRDKNTGFYCIPVYTLYIIERK